MIGNIFGSDGLIVLMVALVVLFGGSQLPKLAKNVGAAGHEFRKAQREAEADHVKDEATVPVVAAVTNMPPTSLSALSAPVPVPVPVPTSVAASDDRLVVSRSELRLELAKLMEERDKPSVS